MRGRSDPEHIQNEKLAIGIPAIGKEASFRRPAVRKVPLAAVHHPWKIDSIINARCQIDDFRVVLEVLACRQHSSQEQSRINGGDFAMPGPLACDGIHVMVKPAVLLGRSGGEKTQRSEHPLARRFLAINRGSTAIQKSVSPKPVAVMLATRSFFSSALPFV